MNATATSEETVNRTAMLPDLPGSNYGLLFLGTASCVPSVTRGVSSMVLRRDGDYWVFDAGEGTQTQIQKSNVKPSRISKIFVTHAHGDHTFGLTGLLCFMGQDYDRDSDPVEIYGPAGLRDYLRASVQLTMSRVVPPYRVHELHGVPFLHSRFSSEPPKPPTLQIGPDPRFGEVPGGQDIWPDEDGFWQLIDEVDSLSMSGGERGGQPGGVVVQAAAMVHTVPCVGFAVQEKPRSGKLRADLVRPILERNVDALKALGNPNPMKLMSKIKLLQPDEVFEFPDGTVITGSEAVSPPRRGRKVVVCGDTCDSSAIAPLAMGCDVLVHEATNAFMLPFDADKSAYEVERTSIQHGHSTPDMAGRFAKRVGAKRLVLNHFSPRYKGDDSRASVEVMQRIEELARRASDLDGTDVIASWDTMELNIPAPPAPEELEHTTAQPAPKLVDRPAG